MEHECVMYQAVLDGNAGSEWSGPAWPYMETIQRAVMAALVTVARSGYQMWRTNITALTSSMNVARTEMTRLKDVRLELLVSLVFFTSLSSSLSQSLKFSLRRIWAWKFRFSKRRQNIRLRPHKRRFGKRPIIGIRIQYLPRIRIQPILETNCPQLRAEQIWVCNAKERQRGHGASQLNKEQRDQNPRPLPPL